MVIGGSDKNRDSVGGVKDIKLRKVGVLACTAMFFSICCSGAYGIEELISESGPGVAIMLLVVVPFVWGYPFAMICAELGATMPVEGGADMWIKWGLGEYWFGISIIKDWIWSLTCNTTFIVLAVAYISHEIPMTNTQQYFMKVGMVGILFVINCLGVKEVGLVSTVVTFLSVGTFALISVIGFSMANHNPVEPFVNPEYADNPMMAVGVSIAISLWCYSGFDEIAMFAGEIEDADRVIPKATLLVIPLMIAVFVIPALAGLSSIGRWDEWSETPGGVGWYTVITNSPVAPAALGVFFVIVSALCMCNIYNVCMVVGSRCGLVMADQHFAPNWLARLSENRRMPIPALVCLMIVTVIMIGTPNHQLEFRFLVMFDAFFTVLHVTLTTIAAAILRRRTNMGSHPGFKVPFGQKGHNVLVIMILILAPMFAIFQGLDYFLICSISFMSLPILYIVSKRLWKGSSVVNPLEDPIDKRTGLGFGDLIKSGGFFLGIGLASWFARVFYPWYEGEELTGYWVTPDELASDEYAQRMLELYGEFSRTSPFGNIYIPGYYEYYNQTGLLSNFDGMLTGVMVIAIISTTIGVILLSVGYRLKRTDYIQLDEIRKLNR